MICLLGRQKQLKLSPPETLEVTMFVLNHLQNG
jgi:hypothetical protein